MPWVATITPERQHEAGQLYLSGMSAQQVADHLEVGLDATFYALRKQGIARRTKTESNRLRFEAKALTYSIKNDLTIGEENLKISAVMLYWAEGYKVGKTTVDFTNSDPDMVYLFVRFLREICGVDERKLRCFMYVYEGQDVNHLQDFWSTLLQIPKMQFTKPYIKSAGVSKRGPRMHKGLVHVRYCDKKLLQQVLI